jgi:sulfatase modifying factor 1
MKMSPLLKTKRLSFPLAGGLWSKNSVGRVLLFLISLWLWKGALWAAPSVSGLSVAVRPGTKLVEVTYDLAGGTTSVRGTVAVWFGVSNDGGATYSVPTVSVAGDVGDSVLLGRRKKIVWDAGTDWPDQVGDQLRVAVRACDLNEPIPGFVKIPGGTYTVGDRVPEADSPVSPEVSVKLSPFYVTVNDTTKARWDTVRAWARRNGYSDLAVGGGKVGTHPVQTVTWYDAVKWLNAASEKEGLKPCYRVAGGVYRVGVSDAVACDWWANGYRLPTEAEWEVAARGGLSGRRFPWGDTISRAQANYLGGPEHFAWDLGPAGINPQYKRGAEPFTSPVGSFPGNGYGLRDMAGNVFQWCWDWYDDGAGVPGGVDPTGPASGESRVGRGGAWSTFANFARCAERYDFDADFSETSLGFRAVRRSFSEAVSSNVRLDTRGVTNVRFSQRSDGSGIVDVFYDLPGPTTAVMMAVSLDGGVTWTSASALATGTSLFTPGARVTGDIGAGITPGLGKRIVWAATQDVPGSGFANLRVRVTALSNGAGTVFAPVPAGNYTIGSNGFTYDAAAVAVRLTAYSMAVTDTTKAQWDEVRTWAVANGYTALSAGTGKASDHPVLGVSWQDAVVWLNAASEKDGLKPCYRADGAVLRGTNAGEGVLVTCDWSANGYRLPTEAEWEVAARGGLVGKLFPWGDTITHAQANYRSSDQYSFDVSPTRGLHPVYGVGNPPWSNPVGVFRANGYGLTDMAGNVSQWCWDLYVSGYSGGTDPRGPAPSIGARVHRGGTAMWKANRAMCFDRRSAWQTAPGISNDVGFRAARSRPSGAGGGVESGVGSVAY